MSRIRTSDRRRAQLARRVETIEAMESRSLITESLGVFTAGIGIPAALSSVRADQVGQAQRQMASYAPSVSVRRSNLSLRDPGQPAAGVVAAPKVDWVMPSSSSSSSAPMAMTVPVANRIAVAQPSASASPSQSGGAVGSAHGGSGSTVPFSPFGSTATAAANPASSSGQGPASNVPPVFTLPAQENAAPATAPRPFSGAAPATSTGAASGPSTGYANLAHAPVFANFPIYTLDVNAGQVMYPGANQLATLGGNVELRAQVKSTAVSSYSWNTSGLTNATAVTGASTADLKFQWATSNATATTNSASLTVTNTSGQTQVQTYTFQVPAGSGTAGTGTLAWPQVVGPDTVSASAPSFAVQNGAIDANSGAFDTAIALPSYNPNVPSVTLAYDSATANPQPIFDLHHSLDPAQATPSQVTAQLTFNGTAGSTVYTNTSQLIPGDVQQIALQANASGLASGRYGYSATTGDVRSTTTTATSTGSTDVVNYAGGAIGSGWTLAGLEKIIPASGGVMLDLGGGGKSLWFANGSGTTYTDPAGDFSTLVANSGGTYTRTMPNGLLNPA